MNVKEKAKIFAIKAHAGQIRKSEKDKPLVIHSISVANILKEYGLEDNVIAAGYLHDVVEDTKYTLEEIKKEFGEDIAKLVSDASEPDKSLSWEKRKKHTIETSKTLPLRSKLLICADKINNLESLYLKFERSGIRDFSAFKAPEHMQKWYYFSVYKSLVKNEDETHPMFVRLKDVLDKLFNPKEDRYMKEVVFSDNPERYENLRKLKAQKEELKRLSKLAKLNKPFVVEFCGTPRTGKTTIITLLEEFFRKGGFKVKVIEEFTTSEYYKNEFKVKHKGLSNWDYNMAIAKEISNQLQEVVNLDYDVVLIDRSINDRQIWNYRRYIKSNVPEISYITSKETFSDLSKKLIDFLIVTYAEPVTVLKRDYASSICLEERHFINYENINSYNNALNLVKGNLADSVNNYMFLDTTDIEKDEVIFRVAKQVMVSMRAEYIDAFYEEISKYID